MKGMEWLAFALMLALAPPVRAGRPWPILVRTYFSVQAGPAVSFALSEDGPTWQGVPGDEIPGTPWLVRAIRFLPDGVVLSDTSRTSACQVAARQSPWYQPRIHVVGDTAAIPRPAGNPEPPPAKGTAAWYAELAREYRFNERFSEAGVVAASAAELGGTDTAPGAVASGALPVQGSPPPLRATNGVP